MLTRRSSLFAVAAVLALGCSSAHENVGESSAQVDYVCSESPSATLDGIPAYAYCGNFNVWSNNGVDTKSASGGSGWVRTEGGYGYQCVEYAIRYSHFKFGTGTSWGINYAQQMCATHPARMSKTTTPVHGDLMIFGGGSCGADATAGHVAVVDVVKATTVGVVQENSAGKQTFNKSCASCFLHDAKNTGVIVPPADAGSDASSPADAAPPSDAGVTEDASPPPTPIDAGKTEDASPPADPGADPGAGLEGCSAAGTHGRPSGFIPLLFGALLLAYRRRRAHSRAR